MAAGAAVTGVVATTFDLGAADAAIPPIGTIGIAKIWGTKWVRKPIPGTSRTERVKTSKTKNLYEGTTKKVLNTGGLCHWYGTPAPLENGNCVLFGHRTSAGGPLRNSHRIKVGDPIEINFDGRSLTYYVSEPPFVVASNDYAGVVLWGDSNIPCVTLVACSKKTKLPTSTKFRLLVRATAP